MTLTQYLVQYLATHADQSFSTDDLLKVAQEEKWAHGAFLCGLPFRRWMLETLRIMESKKRIVSGKNFYRPAWRISPEWMESVGRRSLAKLQSFNDNNGRVRVTICPLTVD
jgi:hypothetical protein